MLQVACTGAMPKLNYAACIVILPVFSVKKMALWCLLAVTQDSIVAFLSRLRCC